MACWRTHQWLRSSGGRHETRLGPDQAATLARRGATLGIGAAVDQVLSLSAHQPPPCLEGEDPDEVRYNMRLLVEAGFLDMTKTQFTGSFNIRGMTWAGHDFLDSVRDEQVWRKTKEGALKAGGSPSTCSRIWPRAS
jgi:hypothetical protein